MYCFEQWYILHSMLLVSPSWNLRYQSLMLLKFGIEYVVCSASTASYLLPWKLQQKQKVQSQYFIQKVLNYKTLFSSIVITISCALSPAMNKSLHAMLVKTCTSRGDPLLLLLEHNTCHLTVPGSAVWSP